MDAAVAEQQDWQHDVFRVLKQHGVKHVVYVPDAGHSKRFASPNPILRSMPWFLPPRRKASAIWQGRGSEVNVARC